MKSREFPEVRKQPARSLKMIGPTNSATLVIYLTIISHLAFISCLQDADPDTTLIGTREPGDGGLVLANPSTIGTKPNEDPENTLNIIQQARNNQLIPEMVTNKTRAMVSCENGEILVKINFTEPFRGVGYANYDRGSPCKFFGEGSTYYEMRLPLKGCGTKQTAPRLFVNDIILRFHRSLELEEDELKTIVCRYPPPVVPAPPPPPGLPAKIVNAPPEPAKLTQYEPFVIIAGLLFFALLLAGIGTTSYVTRKQVIKPINTPLPITSVTEYDTYVDNQSIITTEDLQTTQTIIPFPKITTHTVDDVFITKLHEIEVEENLIHHKQAIHKPHLELHQFDDAYLTNQDEIVTEDTLTKQKLAQRRRLDKLEYDDAYLTNQDELIDEENLTHHKMLTSPPKLELRTIEDTFVTKVEEIIEDESTTHLTDHHQSNRQEEEYRSQGDDFARELEYYKNYRREC